MKDWIRGELPGDDAARPLADLDGAGESGQVDAPSPAHRSPSPEKVCRREDGGAVSAQRQTRPNARPVTIASATQPTTKASALIEPHHADA